jgi:hypothetical protein
MLVSPVGMGLGYDAGQRLQDRRVARAAAAAPPAEEKPAAAKEKPAPAESKA